MDRGEWDGPDRVERETRLRGVSLGSISGLPGATFPFPLVYLLSTKHRSFFVPVRLSRSLDHSGRSAARDPLAARRAIITETNEQIRTCFHCFLMDVLHRNLFLAINIYGCLSPVIQYGRCNNSLLVLGEC